jgi:hypothetical protein
MTLLGRATRWERRSCGGAKGERFYDLPPALAPLEPAERRAGGAGGFGLEGEALAVDVDGR